MNGMMRMMASTWVCEARAAEGISDRGKGSARGRANILWPDLQARRHSQTGVVQRGRIRKGDSGGTKECLWCAVRDGVGPYVGSVTNQQSSWRTLDGRDESLIRRMEIRFSTARKQRVGCFALSNTLSVLEIPALQTEIIG